MHPRNPYCPCCSWRGGDPSSSFVVAAVAAAVAAARGGGPLPSVVVDAVAAARDGGAVFSFGVALAADGFFMASPPRVDAACLFIMQQL